MKCRNPIWPSPRTAAILIALLVAAPAAADAIVVTRAMQASTIAEFFVDPDEVRVELEIGLSDIAAFQNLLPDELYEKLGNEPAPLAERLERFFVEDMPIVADPGGRLPGRVAELAVRPRVRRDEITGDPLPVVEDDPELVVFARLSYPLTRRPATLTLKPPTASRANIGFVVYHQGLPVNDFRYLAVDELLRLDWGDPWYSKFDNRNLRRQYDAPVSAFLYVEPYEVRKEIVVRPKDLEGWVDLGLAGRDVIPVAEQEALKRRVVEFLDGKNRVTVDGEPVEGTLDRVHFIRRSLRMTGVVDPPEDLDVVSATLGVIWVYPTSGLPEKALLEWELFNDRIQRVPASATDEAGGLPYFLTPDDPNLEWQNFLQNPTLPELVVVESPPTSRRAWWLLACVAGGLGLVVSGARYRRAAAGGGGASLVTGAVALLAVAALGFGGFQLTRGATIRGERADGVVVSLLGNIYRAFDYHGESAIYDQLAKSAAGELLTDIYLETRKSLEIENQGGARARVQEVELVAAEHEPLDGGVGFVAHCTWNVSGSVGHWGHLHRRKNQYEARLTVEAVDGAWKVTDLDLIQEQRL